MKQKLSILIRAAISIGLIVLLLYIMRGKYGEIAAALQRTNPLIFAAAFGIYLGAVILASLRLLLIVRAQEIPITFPESVSLTFIGYFFNNFLPTSIGGDVVKAYYVSHKKAHERTTSYTAVFVDRAIGLVTMVLMAFCAVLLAKGSLVDPSIRNMIYAITAVSAIGIFFLAHKGFAQRFTFLLIPLRPVEKTLKKVYHSINQYRHHKWLMAQSLAISVVSQLLYFCSIGLTALSIGSRISVGDILLRMPIVSMISLLPSINGLGVREGSTVLLFGPIIGKENAFAVSILILAVLLIVSVIGGVIYMVSPQFKVKLKEVAA